MVDGAAREMVSINSKGYIQIWKPDHHFASRRGYVMEHRLVWEEHHNAVLLPWAEIHHKNGVRDDNSIENLQAIDRSKHNLHHMKQRRDQIINKRKCARCDRDTKRRIRRVRGYVYRTAEWNRNPLDRTEWLCKMCFKTINRHLHASI